MAVSHVALRFSTATVVTVAIALAPATAPAMPTKQDPVDDRPVSDDDLRMMLTMPDGVRPNLASETAAAPEPPTIMPSRLSLGLRSGYGSPLGSLALVADYYPVSWFGLEGATAVPVLGEPMTFAESALFGWRMADWLEQGLGVGMAQSFVTNVGSAGHPGTLSYITMDVSHFTFYLSRRLSLRTSLDLAFPLDGYDFCSAHPGSCPRTTPFGLGGNAALLWSFDLSGGGA